MLQVAHVVEDQKKKRILQWAGLEWPSNNTTLVLVLWCLTVAYEVHHLRDFATETLHTA